MTTDRVLLNTGPSGRGWSRLSSFMHCHPPGTLINELRRGLIPIEAIGEEDHVLTHQGTFGRVYGRGEAATDALIKFQCARFRLWHKATAEHPYYVRRGRFEGFLPAGALRVGDLLRLVNVPPQDLTEIDAVETLAPFGKVVEMEGAVRLKNSHKSIHRRIRVDKYLAEFIGLFVAEGSTSLSTAASVVLSFGKNRREMQRAERAAEMIHSLFGVAVNVEDRGAVLAVRTIGKTLATLLRAWVGVDSLSKKLPEWITRGKRDIALAAFIGWLKGDGYLGGENRTDISGTTASRMLALQWVQLLSRHGIDARLYEAPARSGRYINGRAIHESPHYTVAVGGKTAWPVADLLGDSSKFKSFRNFGVFERDEIGAWVEITNLETEPYRGPVYTFGVFGTESYVANGLATHNCPRHYAFEHEEHGFPENRGPLVRGTLIHVGLAHLYARWRADQRGENPDVFHTPLDAIRLVAPAHGRTGEDMRILVEPIVERYAERWASDPNVYEIIAVEERYEALVRGHRFTQRLDLVLKDRGGYYWVVDHKSCSKIEAKVFTRYVLSGQFLAMQHYGAATYGEKLGGVRVNVVGMDGHFARKTSDPAPHSLAHFASTVEYVEGNIARLVQLGKPAAEWPGALSETSCYTPYGQCPWFERCRWGNSPSPVVEL